MVILTLRGGDAWLEGEVACVQMYLFRSWIMLDSQLSFTISL